MTPGENINQFAEEVAKRLNEVDQHSKNIIDDSKISTDKTWSSSKIVTYIKPTHRVRFDYNTGDSQIFNTGQRGIKVMSVLVNGVGLDISQYNDDREENTADGTIEILDQLSNSDYIDIYYEK